VFTLRAVQQPASIPVSVASLNLVTQASNSFISSLIRLFQSTGSFTEKVESVRKLYEVAVIPNQVVGGTVPFPEDVKSLSSGISIEFK
jgi:hypothetical protein